RYNNAPQRAERARSPTNKRGDRPMTKTTTYTRDEILATGCGTEIAADALENGYLPKLIRDNGHVGDARIALYECGDVQAITTNGGAIWEDADWEEVLQGLLGETTTLVFVYGTLKRG